MADTTAQVEFLQHWNEPVGDEVVARVPGEVIRVERGLADSLVHDRVAKYPVADPEPEYDVASDARDEPTYLVN